MSAQGDSTFSRCHSHLCIMPQGHRTLQKSLGFISQGDSVFFRLGFGTNGNDMHASRITLLTDCNPVVNRIGLLPDSNGRLILSMGSLTNRNLHFLRKKLFTLIGIGTGRHSQAKHHPTRKQTFLHYKQYFKDNKKRPDRVRPSSKERILYIRRNRKQSFS